MTSIERTAYPRLGRLVSARELMGMSPSLEEVLWARSVACSDAHLLALVLSLKCFQRLGYFPRRGDIPDVVTNTCADAWTWPTTSNRRWDRSAPGRPIISWCASGSGCSWTPERARAVAGGAIRAAAEVMNNPPDLINVALEMAIPDRSGAVAIETSELSARSAARAVPQLSATLVVLTRRCDGIRRATGWHAGA
jgi:hypothetical protein